MNYFILVRITQQLRGRRITWLVREKKTMQNGPVGLSIYGASTESDRQFCLREIKSVHEQLAGEVIFSWQMAHRLMRVSKQGGVVLYRVPGV